MKRMKYDPTKSKTLIRSYDRALQRRISRFWKYVKNPLYDLIKTHSRIIAQDGERQRIENSSIADIERLLNEYEGRFLRPKLKEHIDRYQRKAYTRGAINAGKDLTAVGINISFEPYPADWRAMEVLVDNNFSLVTNANADMKKEMLRVISKGVLEGSSMQKMARNLQKSIGMNRNRATMIARTETINAYNTGAINQYKKVGVKKWKWITTYDERTCQQCAPRDGRTYPMNADRPPIHPSCRCTVSPVVEKIK